MIQYDQRLRPILECIGLLEHYVNQDINIKELITLFPEYENELVIWNTLIEKAGSILEETGKDLIFLFQYLKKDGVSSLIRYMIQPTIKNCPFVLSKQYDDIFAYYAHDSAAFLKKIVTLGTELNEKDIQITTLPQLLDDTLYSDDMKWKIWKIHLHFNDYLQHIVCLLQRVMPLYEEHQDIYQKFLTIYQQDVKQGCQGKDCYEYLCEHLHLHFDQVATYIIPVFTDINEMTLMLQKKEQEEVLIVFLGITMMRKTINEETSISTQELCTTLKLLSDPSKFDILRYISNKKAYGAQIANELGLSTPTISYHMQALMNHRLITFEKENQRLYYQLNKEYLKKLLQQVEEIIVKE